MSRQVRFSRAVFTHPADLPPLVLQTLMHASKASGLFPEEESLDAFVTRACIDEATAGALFYVHGRASEAIRVVAPPADMERVLCFDCGGGTTDVAAVEVTNLASFLAQQAERVQVRLCGTDGESRFGGDDIDLMIVGHILGGIREREDGKYIDTDEIEGAAHAPSYADFRDGYLKRKAEGRSVSGSTPVNWDDHIQRICSTADQLRNGAEAAKRGLSERDQVELVLGAMDWPKKALLPETVRCEDISVVIRRDKVEQAVSSELGKHLDRLLGGVLKEAGWGVTDVDTLLFAGQSTRMSCVRRQVLAWTSERRGTRGKPLLILEPGDGTGFEPKQSVAAGAAILGMSRAEGDWLEVVWNRDSLPYSLQQKTGPIFREIPGLTRNTPLPARAVLAFHIPLTSFTVYKNRRPFVLFRFPSSTKVEIEISKGGYTLLTPDGTRYEGEVAIERLG